MVLLVQMVSAHHPCISDQLASGLVAGRAKVASVMWLAAGRLLARVTRLIGPHGCHHAGLFTWWSEQDSEARCAFQVLAWSVSPTVRRLKQAPWLRAASMRGHTRERGHRREGICGHVCNLPWCFVFLFSIYSLLN